MKHIGGAPPSTEPETQKLTKKDYQVFRKVIEILILELNPNPLEMPFEIIDKRGDRAYHINPNHDIIREELSNISKALKRIEASFDLERSIYKNSDTHDINRILDIRISTIKEQ